jgi:hypothetical protein
MNKRILVGLLAACFLASGLAPVAATTYKTVPKPVIEFYNDVLGMFSAMLKELNAAKDAKAVAKAFDKASATAKDKKLSSRYQALVKQYPEFFTNPDNLDSAWVPPADWIKISEDFNRQMADYGQNAGNIMASMGTEEVLAAMERFGAVMESLAPAEE